MNALGDPFPLPRPRDICSAAFFEDMKRLRVLATEGVPGGYHDEEGDEEEGVELEEHEEAAIDADAELVRLRKLYLPSHSHDDLGNGESQLFDDDEDGEEDSQEAAAAAEEEEEARDAHIEHFRKLIRKKLRRKAIAEKLNTPGRIMSGLTKASLQEYGVMFRSKERVPDGRVTEALEMAYYLRQQQQGRLGHSGSQWRTPSGVTEGGGNYLSLSRSVRGMGLTKSVQSSERSSSQHGLGHQGLPTPLPFSLSTSTSSSSFYPHPHPVPFIHYGQTTGTPHEEAEYGNHLPTLTNNMNMTMNMNMSTAGGDGGGHAAATTAVDGGDAGVGSTTMIHALMSDLGEERVRTLPPPPKSAGTESSFPTAAPLLPPLGELPLPSLSRRSSLPDAPLAARKLSLSSMGQLDGGGSLAARSGGRAFNQLSSHAVGIEEDVALTVHWKPSKRSTHMAYPLHWAVMGRSHRAIRYLVQHGADPELGVLADLRPRDVAVSNGLHETLHVLEKSISAYKEALQKEEEEKQKIESELEQLKAAKERRKMEREQRAITRREQAAAGGDEDEEGEDGEEGDE